MKVMDHRLKAAEEAMTAYGVIPTAEREYEAFKAGLYDAILAADGVKMRIEASPQPLETVHAPRTTLKFELERFAADYPNLKVHIGREEHPEAPWECVISTMTTLFGEYGIFQREGPTKRLALLDARRRPDEERAEADRLKRATQLRQAAAHAVEQRLDDALYSSI